MVTLTKLNGQTIVVNADLVEFIESTPDCLISMTTGRKLMVRESVDQLKELIVEYRRAHAGAYPVPAGGEGCTPQDFPRGVEEPAPER